MLFRSAVTRIHDPRNVIYEVPIVAFLRPARDVDTTCTVGANAHESRATKVRAHRAPNLIRGCVGRSDEWHLDHPNPIPHIAFGVPPGFSEVAIVFGSPFSETRFIPIRSVSDAMDRDRVKQLVVKAVAER